MPSCFFFTSPFWTLAVFNLVENVKEEMNNDIEDDDSYGKGDDTTNS